MRNNPVDHPVASAIRDRWSPVAFDGASLDTATLLSLFESGRWAASAFNEQPWRFLVAARDETEQFERMLSCIVPGNREWAAHAGALVIVCCAKSFARNGKPNGTAQFDTGQAVAHLLLQAAELGIQGHPMGGYDAARARELYEIDDDVDTVCAIAFGKPGDGSLVDAETAKRDQSPRARKGLDEMVFAEKFGRKAEWLG